MIKHAFFAVTIGLAIFFLYLLQYTGAFKSVAVGLDERGPYIFLFKEHTGPYHKLVDHIQAVETWAKENKMKCRFTFGEYFDDPGATEEGRLKSRGGCIVDPIDSVDMQALSAAKLPEGFKKADFGKSKAVVALFSGSPGIGPYKVYPKAIEYMQIEKLKQKSPVIEIYEVLNKYNMNTIYLWPVE